MLLYRDRAYTNLNARLEGELGREGKAELKALQQEYRDAHEAAQDGLRTDALLEPAPRDRAVRRRLRAAAPQGAASRTSTTCCSGRATCCADSKPARDYFRRRYKVVLIDEFQDTDPVQAELALLLTSDEEPDGDWRELRPAPGRLTVVGDPKQSIYRFRRADIAVYDQVRSRALRRRRTSRSPPTSARTRSCSPRSTHVFDQVLEQQPGVQPANVSLDAPPGAPRTAKRPPVMLADRARSRATPTIARREEARAIAALLHTAHAERWEIRDRHDGDRWRPCRWGDMAILMPARTGIELYEDALADAGIPYRHEGSRDFYQRQEVRDLIWVLAAIDDPTDRLALVGALRSSAFAINDEDLVRHRAEAGSLSYRSKTEGPIAAVNEALAELANLHRMRTRFSLAETVRRVVERTRLVEFALTRPDGDQGAANLLAIVDQARLFAAAGGGGLQAVHPPPARLDRARTQIEIEATVAEETDDVVRIMTIHGAKGLEYPIVALANLAARNPNHAQPVPREHEHFLHFRVGAGSARTPRPLQDPRLRRRLGAGEAARRGRAPAAALRRRHPRPRAPDRPRASPASLGAKGLLGELVHEPAATTSKLVRAGRARRARRSPTSTRRARARSTDADIDAGRRRARALARRTVEQLKRTAAEPRKIEIASSRERAARPARRRGRHLRRRPGDRRRAADPDRRRGPHGDGARHAPATRTTSSRSPTTSARRARSPTTPPTSSRCAAPASTRPASSAPSSSGAGGARCRS